MTWEDFAALPPGTTFINASYILVKMKPRDSYHVGSGDLFSIQTGTIHHGSEFIDFYGPVQHDFTIYPPGHLCSTN